MRRPALCRVAVSGISAAESAANEDITVDYGKSGVPKMGKNKPRHAEHNAKGTKKNPFGKQADKSDLLKRMKAAADKAKKED
ncbi:hypothetical protein K3722_02965 [Leisingera caerulea]|uniref:Uncharacterized protein n=1 Tax=Leisingera caerulea TaxID=506591 RepID=A0ABY5X1T5_LEICA|nr:hypothetical protein [Leisingera caerulea]UWQ51759.1 hypothetical protein K3720_03195 [Leisingera caerulea]UWQ60576.1 hypothetical protein K3722_02965 [Leisingera caerulea]UWQ85549.1 hypothetical protein K3726_02865 [Leisingera caerulea]